MPLIVTRSRWGSCGPQVTPVRAGAHRAEEFLPGKWRLFAVDQVEASPSSRLVPDTREQRGSDQIWAGATRRAPATSSRPLGSLGALTLNDRGLLAMRGPVRLSCRRLTGALRALREE